VSEQRTKEQDLPPPEPVGDTYKGKHYNEDRADFAYLRDLCPWQEREIERAETCLVEIENWVDRWYGKYGSTRPTAAHTFAEIGKVLDRWRTNG
jgi:hypothetical protein